MSKVPNALRGQLDDETTVIPAENDEAAIRITSQRAAHVNLRSAAGTEISPATEGTLAAASGKLPATIGQKASAASLAVVLSSEQELLAPVARLSSSELVLGTTSVTPKFAAVEASVAGDNTAVAAVAGKKIRVLSYALTAAATSTFRWKSGAATNLSGLMAAETNRFISAEFNPVGHFQTAAGEALVLNLSTLSDLDGHLTYIEV